MSKPQSKFKKNPVLAKAKAHWNEIISMDPVKIYVAEWDTDIYVWPATVAEQDKIVRAEGLDRLIQTIIVRSKNADGKRLFQDYEAEVLANSVSPAVIVDVATAMFEADAETTPNPDEAIEDLD